MSCRLSINKDPSTCSVVTWHLIRTSFDMFPVSFTPFFVFSLHVTDRCHQREHKFQILSFTQRDSCSTQAHFLIALLTFSHTLHLCVCVCRFPSVWCHHNSSWQKTQTLKKGLGVRIIYSKRSCVCKRTFLLYTFLNFSLHLLVSLRFHHSTDDRHQRKANRLHPDVGAHSSRDRVDTC